MTSSRFAGSFVCLLTPTSRRRRTPLAPPFTSSELMADPEIASLSPEEKADRIADCLGLRDGSYVELVPAFVSYAGSVDHLTVEHGFGYRGLPLAFDRVVGHRKPSTSQAGSCECHMSSPRPIPPSVPAPPGPDCQRRPVTHEAHMCKSSSFVSTIVVTTSDTNFSLIYHVRT